MRVKRDPIPLCSRECTKNKNDKLQLSEFIYIRINLNIKYYYIIKYKLYSIYRTVII